MLVETGRRAEQNTIIEVFVLLGIKAWQAPSRARERGKTIPFKEVFSSVTMAENYHVILFNVGLLICLSNVSHVSAQTVPSCKADGIKIEDPVTGSVQCQECIKCPAGQGLSVKCGDTVTPQTPLVCKPCVLGETYSSAYEAGACNDCKNCRQNREIKKACTLTSNAECGNCTLGAYKEPMLGACKQCSACCNDGNDIIMPECQVLGVPANMQCSYARSEKCSKMNAKSSTTTAAPNLQLTPEPVTTPALETTPPTVAPFPVSLEPAAKQVVPAKDDLSPNRAVIGAAIGGSLLVVLIVVLIPLVVRYKRRQVSKGGNNKTKGDIAVQAKPEDNQSDGGESAEDPLMNDNERVRLSVEETTESPLPTGTQDTQPPGPHNSTAAHTPVQSLRPEQSCDNHSHTKFKKTTLKETTVYITACKY